jgi:hypothetical protein
MPRKKSAKPDAAPPPAAEPLPQAPAGGKYAQPEAAVPHEPKGRTEIDSFEAALQREKRTTGFFVAFDYSSDALAEIGAFFKRTGIMIRALTVKDILDEQIARKLA